MTMTTRQKAGLAGGAIVLLVGLAFHARQHAAAQRDHLQDARARHATLLAELENEKKRSAGIVAARTAEKALFGHGAAKGDASPAGTATAAIATEAKAWLARVVELRGMFARNPQFAIPELSLLTDMQWIQAARVAELDTDEQIRQSLAAVRTAAKEELNGRLASAFQRYIGATDGRLPPTLAEVLPYFVRPVDPAMLDRYELAPVGNMKDLPAGTQAVREKAPVDEDYDSRMIVDRTGRRGSAGNNARAWLEAPDGYSGMISRAQAGYARANNGAKGGGLEQLAPYVDPPLPPEKLRKLIELEKKFGL
jgi:hypothetical protein